MDVHDVHTRSSPSKFRGKFHHPASSHFYIIAECSTALAVLAMIFNRTFRPIRYRPAIVSERHASKALLAEEERTWIIAAQG